MILYPENWLFVSTMKCATNTLYKDLKTIPGTQWVGGNMFHGIPTQRMAPIHWTVVRNPYARAVSIWASTCARRKEAREKYDAYTYIKNKGRNPLRFADFVDLVLLEQPPLRVPWLYKNQSDWISRFICDEFLHLENLQADLETKLGITLELSMENTSPHDKWEKYYTPQLKEKVRQWADLDFLGFGYPIDGLDDGTVVKGRALPGAEERADTMDIRLLESMTLGPIYPGTVNIQCVRDVNLGPPKIHLNEYMLWPCKLDGAEWTNSVGWIDGWVIKFTDEPNLPPNYLEFISGDCVRDRLTAHDFPSFIVKLKL